MFIIAFKGLGISTSNETLWKIACLSLVWFVWQERNAMIFENKERLDGEVWDILYFYSSLWASCTTVFRGVPLTFLHLNWLVVCHQPHEKGYVLLRDLPIVMDYSKDL